jgi:hypothetical protein
MQPSMGRIVHIWDSFYGCWRAGIITEVNNPLSRDRCFSATMFRSLETVPFEMCWFIRENQEMVGGWRWPPREDT